MVYYLWLYIDNKEEQKNNIEQDKACHVSFVQIHVHNPSDPIDVHSEPYIAYIYALQYIKAVHKYLKRTLTDWWGICFSFGATL